MSAHRLQRARSPVRTWIVVEADESDGCFLRLEPYVAVVTNVEADHLDLLGRPGGAGGRVRRVRRLGEPARRVRRDLRRRPRGRGPGPPGARRGRDRRCTYGTGAGRRLPADGSWSRKPTGYTIEITSPDGGRRRRRDCGCRAGTTRSTRRPRFAVASGSASPRTTSWPGLAAFRGTRRRFDFKGEVGRGAGLRRLRPPSHRDRRDPARRPGVRRGGRLVVALPGPPLLPDGHVQPRVRRGPRASPTGPSCSRSTRPARPRSRAPAARRWPADVPLPDGPGHLRAVLVGGAGAPRRAAPSRATSS